MSTLSDSASHPRPHEPAPVLPPAPAARAPRVEGEGFDPVVGWLVVIEGPGRVEAVPLKVGLNTIGRDPARNRAPLDFGDGAISREAHASLAYDERERTFWFAHGNKANLVRVNGRPVLATVAISDGDVVEIGLTLLRFVALCGPRFDWADPPPGSLSGAS